MSLKTTVGIAALAMLGCAAGAFYWLHARGEQRLPEVVTAEPPGFRETPSAEKTSTTAPAKPILPTDSKKDAPPVDTGLPLRAGEVLEYTANISKLSNVASLRLQVAGRGNFLGKSTWHLQAFAHTQDPLRMVFELDDQFDSYSDAGTLTSLQYEMRLSERGQKVESIQRMTATGKEPASPSPVYDGHKLYDVRAKLAPGFEKVNVPAGDFTASKIAIRVFDGGVEMKDASFTLFVANNAARTPVLLEAVLPFATARVELQKAK